MPLLRKPAVSVIVVVYNIEREAPRTLFSLSAQYQRDIDSADYEIIVVDNGSHVPLTESEIRKYGANFRLIRIDNAPPSPAHAINVGLAAARGDVIGVMIDGARIATPGLLNFARAGATMYPQSVVATLGFYLGYGFQGWSVTNGYDRAKEDALLESIGWPADGYRLFEIATMDESSVDGWFAPIAESNAVFARRALWDAIGGFDERFDVPGGGLVNLDTLKRLLDAVDGRLVMLLGEGTFHQVHGGISTNAPYDRQNEQVRQWGEQYVALRGHAWSATKQTRAYVGTLSHGALRRFVRAAMYPGAQWPDDPLGNGFDRSTWSLKKPRATPDDPITQIVELGLRYFREGNFEASYVLVRFLCERGMDCQGLEEINAVASGTSTARTDPGIYRERQVVLGQAFEIVNQPDGAVAAYRAALADGTDIPEAHLGLARIRMPGENYIAWLKRFYQELEPESVLEIGVYHGESLVLPEPPTIVIGVDPSARILQPLRTQTHVFPETSDDFFASGKLRTILGDRPVSIGFIDGLHTFEQALRDFINLEACCDARSHIFLHDTVPLDEATQAREQRTTFYTGDVWKLVLCLQHYRPDLDLFTIAAFPTGLTVVRNLDPASRVLERAYGDAVARYRDLPYSTIEADLYEKLAVIANDRNVVEARLQRPTLSI